MKLWSQNVFPKLCSFKQMESQNMSNFLTTMNWSFEYVNHITSSIKYEKEGLQVSCTHSYIFSLY